MLEQFITILGFAPACTASAIVCQAQEYLPDFVEPLAIPVIDVITENPVASTALSALAFGYYAYRNYRKSSNNGSDIYRFLEIVELKDIFNTYSLAYLQQKHVPFTENQPNIDNQWNFGPCEESYLIKTEDNSLFTIFSCPNIVEQESAIRSQIVSANLQDKFLDIIAHLIANGHNRLPCQNIKLAFCINHLNTHWTMLLAEFNDLAADEYQDLYNRYQRYAANVEQAIDDGTAESFRIRRNQVKNFIIADRNISFTQRIPFVEELEFGNWRLPIHVNGINLVHCDSMGMSTDYQRNVELSATAFTEAHHATFQGNPCPSQSGHTCGDWTVFNAFNLGVLGNRSYPISSQVLRRFSENCSIQNGQQVLFTSQKRNIQSIPFEHQINHARQQLMVVLQNEDNGTAIKLDN